MKFYHIILFLSPLYLFSQGKRPKGDPVVNWIKNPFEQKFFIENKGQFNKQSKFAGSKIFFGVDDLNTQIFFTKKGLTYYCNETSPRENEKGEAENLSGNELDIKDDSPPPLKQALTLEWLNANNKTEIVPENIVPEYFTYGSEVDPVKNSYYNVRAYKKIIYKNLYNHIDVEYTFHPQEGIKYALIVYPGGDITTVRMKYTETNKIAQDERGHLNISTRAGTFIDHAPATLYEADRRFISSSFIINEDQTIGFKIENYDKNKTIVIDPWIINPGFLTQNIAYDIAQDASGNIYVYGGKGPWQLKKFNSGGTIQWTFNTTYYDWYGDLAVDDLGNAYISQGCCGASIQKTDPMSNVIWKTKGGYSEYWCLSFNCAYTKLYLGTGYASITNQNHSIGEVDLNTGKVIGATALNSGSAEPRAIAWGPNGNIYFLSCSSNDTLDPGNRVLGVTPSFANIFSVPNGHNLAYNGPAYTNGGNTTSGQNGIAAHKNFLCTSDGAVLFKRSLTTGAELGRVVIPGGVTEGNSGVLIDDCGNIYVGSSDKVCKFDSALTLLTSVSTTGAVYCLYEGLNGEVLACGNGFIASLALNYCPESTLGITTSTSPDLCGGFPGIGTASATADGAEAPYTYLWNNGATTSTITGLSGGNYTVTAIDAGGCIYNRTTVTVPGGEALNASIITTKDLCLGTNNGTATANPLSGTPPFTFLWSTEPSQTTQEATGLAAGIYSVSVTDNNGCNFVSQFVIECDEKFSFYVPQSFTPNDDGINDFFICKASGMDLSSFKMYVFDRWGNLIFESTDFSPGWNGKINGTDELAQIDTYIWEMKFLDTISGRAHEYVGKVNLIR